MAHRPFPALVGTAFCVRKGGLRRILIWEAEQIKGGHASTDQTSLVAQPSH
jgi:hypothetical protein